MVEPERNLDKSPKELNLLGAVRKRRQERRDREEAQNAANELYHRLEDFAQNSQKRGLCKSKPLDPKSSGLIPQGWVIGYEEREITVTLSDDSDPIEVRIKSIGFPPNDFFVVARYTHKIEVEDLGYSLVVPPFSDAYLEYQGVDGVIRKEAPTRGHITAFNQLLDMVESQLNLTQGQ